MLTNPPFGGEEEASVKSNFPADKQTAESWASPPASSACAELGTTAVEGDGRVVVQFA